MIWFRTNRVQSRDPYVTSVRDTCDSLPPCPHSYSHGWKTVRRAVDAYRYTSKWHLLAVESPTGLVSSCGTLSTAPEDAQRTDAPPMSRRGYVLRSCAMCWTVWQEMKP